MYECTAGYNVLHNVVASKLSCINLVFGFNDLVIMIFLPSNAVWKGKSFESTAFSYNAV